MLPKIVGGITLASGVGGAQNNLQNWQTCLRDHWHDFPEISGVFFADGMCTPNKKRFCKIWYSVWQLSLKQKELGMRSDPLSFNKCDVVVWIHRVRYASQRNAQGAQTTSYSAFSFLNISPGCYWSIFDAPSLLTSEYYLPNFTWLGTPPKKKRSDERCSHQAEARRTGNVKPMLRL